MNVALASLRLDPDIVEDMVKIERRTTGAGAKEYSKAWEAEGVFQEEWGYAIRGGRRYRVAIAWELGEDDG